MLKWALNIALFGAFALIVIVLGFFLWQTLFGSEEQSYSEPKTEPTQYEQSTGTENPGGAGALPSGTNSSESAIANYTKWLAIFTLFLVLATIGLFISGERSVQVASRAATAANESAVAATSAADTSKQALIAGQRAFVAVGGYNHSNVRDPQTAKVTGYYFSVSWTNAGDTPTRNMFNHISIKVTDTPLVDNWDFPDLWAKDIPVDKRIGVRTGIAPRGTIDSESLYIPIGIIADVIAGTKFLYFWGWTAYDDVFPNTSRHINRFATRIVISGDANDPDRTSFTFSWLPKYNCSDEECDTIGYPASWKARDATE